MCSTPELGGKLVAVYKVSQSVGAAIAYQLTTDDLSPRKQFISNWCIIAITLLVARKLPDLHAYILLTVSSVPAILMITEPTEEEARGGMTEGEKVDMIPDDFKKTEKEVAL